MTTLAVFIIGVSLLGATSVVIWRPHSAVLCAAQVVLLLVLLGVIAQASETAARLALSAASSILMIVYWKQSRLTALAAVLAGGTSLFVLLLLPTLWSLAMAFLFGWANLVGHVDMNADGPHESRSRDMTDLAPAAIVVVLGAAIVNSDPTTAAVIIFSALGFIVNDVLASELGPQLPGHAYLLPNPDPVPHGTFGAMSFAGTLAGAFGSFCAAFCAGALVTSARVAVAVFAAGLVGALIDTGLSRRGIRGFMGRDRELINAAGCAAAIVTGLFLA